MLPQHLECVGDEGLSIEALRLNQILGVKGMNQYLRQRYGLNTNSQLRL